MKLKVKRRKEYEFNFNRITYFKEYFCREGFD